MVNRKALLSDLIKQVRRTETDLGEQVKAVPEASTRLRAEYDQARKLGRTASTWTPWLDERITQVAVAWVLGTVFVRFSEDNHLIPEPYLTAPGADRRDLALARYEAYVEDDDNPTYRGWLEQAFAELGAGQAGTLLFDRAHNPLFQIPLSHDGARTIVDFWRGRDEQGVLIHDFTDPLSADRTDGWDTRFLGDLYQDLSEAARSAYALLQTPEFVEEFILDRAMEPALREFGHIDFKMIDPTCGSGHFVLGAFRRLIRHWSDKPLGRGLHEQVAAALDSVYGVDLNPFAIAIARFRLLIAAMAAANIRTLTEAAKYEWPLHLAIGDSLIKARQPELALSEESNDPLSDFSYATEDIQDHPAILQRGRYHVVVGNPPYVTVKDKDLKEIYRRLYDACFGLYALTVPFIQRFFELAKVGDSEGQGYGRVGLITANSFMKREFGIKLIEEYFAHKVELTEVIDTSGAYIPGHGTPTVILVGMRRSGSGRRATIRTVRSVQGEPSAPENAKNGFVWKAILTQIDQPSSVSPWVSTADLNRERYFGKQPWILADGGLEIIEEINKNCSGRVGDRVLRVGFYGDSHADDAFFIENGGPLTTQPENLLLARSQRGEQVRDWCLFGTEFAAFPYDENHSLLNADQLPLSFVRHFWIIRTDLWARTLGSGKTYSSSGRPWWAWHQLPRDIESHPWTIAFGEVSTHNHWVLDREGRVFNRTAPVIKLRGNASDEEYLRLLGLLNSSTACLWLKLNCHDKGIRGEGGGFTSSEWERFYQFNGSNVERFPLSRSFPEKLATELDSLARDMAALNSSTINHERTPTAAALRDGRSKQDLLRARMIALQEELDWQVYSLYGLHAEDLRAPEKDVPGIALGERAFEIVLARRVAAGEASGEWFKRHGSTQITEIPEGWPEAYRQVVQKRIDAIKSSRAIGMVERPEYKRRWATEGWDVLQERAMRSWLLDRIEARENWFDDNRMPVLVTLHRLADTLSRDEDFVSVAGLYAPRKELAMVVGELLSDEHVPFLAALRYKPSGLKKVPDWNHVWDLQRQEDAASDEPAKRRIRDSIPVPPKYSSADFVKPSYWRARGKLDVPRERFISYSSRLSGIPDLYGWAGWDHREQAQALATYFTNQALSDEEITPFLAGLLELQPWLTQWHDDFDPRYGGSPAAFFAGYRQQVQGEHGLTDEDLKGWRPVKAARGRAAKK